MVKLTNQVDVQTIPTRIVYPNPNRTSLIIRNIGNYVIYIGTDMNVSVTNGFQISPGNAISLTKELGDNPELEFWAISDGGVGRIAWLEQVKIKE